MAKTWEEIDPKYRALVLSFIKGLTLSYKEFGSRFYDENATEIEEGLVAALAMLEVTDK